jgi:hypothetical protein
MLRLTAAATAARTTTGTGLVVGFSYPAAAGYAAQHPRRGHALRFSTGPLAAYTH